MTNHTPAMPLPQEPWTFTAGDGRTYPRDPAVLASTIDELRADRARLVAALRDAQTALDAGLNSGDAVSAAQEMDDAALMLRALLAELGE